MLLLLWMMDVGDDGVDGGDAASSVPRLPRGDGDGDGDGDDDDDDNTTSSAVPESCEDESDEMSSSIEMGVQVRVMRR